MKKLLTFAAVHSKWFILGGLILLLLLPSVIKSQYLIRIAMLCIVNVMLAVSLNLLFGFLGQMSFGHVAFYGLGSYTAALLATKCGVTSTLLMFLCSMIVSGILGLLLGLPVLKLKGYYLAIVTMGFCEIVRQAEVNWISLTNGPLGVKNIPKPFFFGVSLNSTTKIYYYAVILLVVITYVVWAMMNSRTGMAILAIREDNLAATSMGIDIVKYKVMAFVVSAMLASTAGVFNAQYSWYIDPSLFTTSISTQINLMVILGGLGNIFGSFLGATILTVLPETLRFMNDYRMLIYGILMVWMIISRPQGMLGNVNFGYLKQRALAYQDDVIESHASNQKLFAKAGKKNSADAHEEAES